jgi:cell division protein FtsB
MRILQGLLIVIILGLQIRLWTGTGSIAEISRLNESITVQGVENTELQNRNRELLTEVEALKDGTDAVEEMAREDLGLIKEGEKFYMIVEAQAESETESEVESEVANLAPVSEQQ